MTGARVSRALAVIAAVMLATLPAASTHAQRATDGASRHGWMRPAKWIALGAAATLAGYAVMRTGRANDVYDSLREVCVAAPSRCELAGGSYVDASTERLYRSAAGDDRHAQRAIIGGQTLLLGSAALFVLDLRDRAPADIPYPRGSANCAAVRCFRLAQLTF